MKASVVPKFIKAKTPEKLSREMLVLQMAKQRKVHFFSIVYDGKFWVAWYEDNYGQ